MDASALQLAQGVLASQPFSALLGTRVVSFGGGRASLELVVRPTLRQQYGFVHGGVLAYLVDNALTFAGGSVLGSTGIVTAEIKVNYLRPATGDGRLIADAVVVGSSKRQAVCRCDVYIETDGERKLVAVGQGTICRSERATEAPAVGVTFEAIRI